MNKNEIYGLFDLYAEKRKEILASDAELLEENAAKPDYIDIDKDGDKKESMKKAKKDKDNAFPHDETYDESNHDKTGGNSDAELLKKVEKKKGAAGKKLIKTAKKELKDKGSVSAKVRDDLARDEYEESKKVAKAPIKENNHEALKSHFKNILEKNGISDMVTQRILKSMLEAYKLGKQSRV